MTEMTLTATVRQGTGSGVARKLRQAGQLPGIIYGLGDPVPIQLDAHAATVLVHALHGSERLISLNLGGSEQRHVLLKAVQKTPLGGKLLHIDFHEVDVTKTVHVSVVVHALGKAAGERDGGIMQQVTYEVPIECLPTIIPDQLTLDVSALMIGDSLHVSDLAMPEGVKVLAPAEETLFVVVAPRVEEEVAPVAPLEPGAVPVEGEAPAAPAEGAEAPAESEGKDKE